MNCMRTELSEKIKASIFSRKEKSLMLAAVENKPVVVLGAFGNYRTIPVFEVHLKVNGTSIDYSSTTMKNGLVILLDECDSNNLARLVIYDCDEGNPSSAGPVLEYDASSPEGVQNLFGYIAIGLESPAGTPAMAFSVFCGKESSFMLDSTRQGIQLFFTCSHLMEKLMGGEHYDYYAARSNPAKL